MYWVPNDAVQRFWSAIAKRLQEHHGLSVATTLEVPQDLHAHWQDPELFVSQTCGYPLSTALHDKVQVLGTFAYDAPGAKGIACRSQLIVRSNDPRTTLPQFAGGIFAFNAKDSQSGFNAPRAWLTAQLSSCWSGALQSAPFFSAMVETGSHRASIEAVLKSAADMASIDCVTLALWRSANPELAGTIKVVSQTDPYPGLPLITGLATPAHVVLALRECLKAVATEPRYAALRLPLLIVDFEETRLSDYAVCLAMEQAVRHGPTLGPAQTPN
jgi:ABC-type phosphate/phosphonate transport system substrate-binding protein